MIAPWKFTDYTGDELVICPGRTDHAEAVIEVNPRESKGSVAVPAHRLAEVVAAMYEAAGQPVPVLPVIHDEREVSWVATLLAESRNRVAGTPPSVADKSDAAYLLAHGVRLPEATA